MDEINKTIIRSNTPPIIDNLKDETGCLLWVDDVVLIADNPTSAQKLLDITNKVASIYHVEFGSAKSKILRIGKNNTPNPVLRLGDTPIEYAINYKYLGETLNTKLNLSDHIKTIKGKTEAAYQHTLLLIKNPLLRNIETQTMWKLFSMCVIPTITYACETWNPTKKEIDTLNKIQTDLLKRMLITPISTPTDALYIQTGTIEVKTHIIISRIRMEQRLNRSPDSKANRVRLANIAKGWNENTTKGKQALGLLDSDTKRQTTTKILNHFKENVNKRALNSTKTKFLLQGIEDWSPHKRPSYMTNLSRHQISTLFKARTRMLDTKKNFPGKTL